MAQVGVVDAAAGPIAFGTSGWRGVLAEDFTLPRARAVVRAIAEILLDEGGRGGEVVLARDTRFHGDLLVREAAEVLSAAGLKPLVPSRSVPTPVASCEVRRRAALGAINFTASHNPPEYQGLKFSPSNGGPAPKGTTEEIATRATSILATGVEPARRSVGAESVYDPRPAYLADLRKKIDLEAVRRARLRVLASPLGGAGAGYLDTLLFESGAEVTAVRVAPDPTFGGRQPEPAPEFIPEILQELRAGDFHLGLFTDGDADRFGVANPDGSILAASEVIAILADSLATRRSKHAGGPGALKGFVVRTVATSNLIDRVASLHGLATKEVPVGFKWIAAEMEADPEGFLIGGEESGGLTVRGHCPEKDGILACLLVAEEVARTGRSPGALLADLFARVGTLLFRRVNLRFDPSAREEILARARAPLERIADRAVTGRNEIDGVKFLLADGSWFLLRFSGTEPVIRLYLEAADEPHLDRIEREARAHLGLS